MVTQPQVALGNVKWSAGEWADELDRRFDLADELDRRFDLHSPSNDRVVSAHEMTRGLMKNLAGFVVEMIPDCAERDAAIEAVDLACMWANAAIARTQLEEKTDVSRAGHSADLPSRQAGTLQIPSRLLPMDPEERTKAIIRFKTVLKEYGNEDVVIEVVNR